MSLSDYDRLLLDRCLDGSPHAWEDFVDRFLGLVIHVVNHTGTSRNVSIDASLRDDLVSDVFLKLIEHDFAILRRFRRQCSLHTYLAVVARRVVSKRLLQHSATNNRTVAVDALGEIPASDGNSEARIADREHVEKLLLRLDGREADIVRMYHLEGRSYREISSVVGIAENSVGSVLSRARQFMRESENGH